VCEWVSEWVSEWVNELRWNGGLLFVKWIKWKYAKISEKWKLWSHIVYKLNETHTVSVSGYSWNSTTELTCVQNTRWVYRDQLHDSYFGWFWWICFSEYKSLIKATKEITQLEIFALFLRLHRQYLTSATWCIE